MIEAAGIPTQDAAHDGGILEFTEWLLSHHTLPAQAARMDGKVANDRPMAAVSR